MSKSIKNTSFPSIFKCCSFHLHHNQSIVQQKNTYPLKLIIYPLKSVHQMIKFDDKTEEITEIQKEK